MTKTMLALFSVLFSGCATVEITKITDSTYRDGLRFYRPEPYLLVTKDGQDKLQTSLIYLPNKKQEYALRTTVGIGTVDMSATLKDGWNLTDIGAKIDSKVPETIEAITGALKAAAGRFQQTSLDPGLYRIDFDDTKGFAIRIVGPLTVERHK